MFFGLEEKTPENDSQPVFSIETLHNNFTKAIEKMGELEIRLTEQQRKHLEALKELKRSTKGKAKKSLDSLAKVVLPPLEYWRWNLVNALEALQEQTALDVRSKLDLVKAFEIAENAQKLTNALVDNLRVCGKPPSPANVDNIDKAIKSFQQMVVPTNKLRIALAAVVAVAIGLIYLFSVPTLLISGINLKKHAAAISLPLIARILYGDPLEEFISGYAANKKKTHGFEIMQAALNLTSSKPGFFGKSSVRLLFTKQASAASTKDSSFELQNLSASTLSA